jgi:hypothetical protein
MTSNETNFLVVGCHVPVSAEEYAAAAAASGAWIR